VSRVFHITRVYTAHRLYVPRSDITVSRVLPSQNRNNLDEKRTASSNLGLGISDVCKRETSPAAHTRDFGIYASWIVRSFV
jgi:hypothetical protein